MHKITLKQMNDFKIYLIEEERSDATIEKYLHNVGGFYSWLSGKSFEKTDVLEYKRFLNESYAPASVNSAISSLNVFLNTPNGMTAA